MVAEDAIGRAHDVVVIPGDEPLVTGEQLKALLARTAGATLAAVVQTTIPDDARGFGRIVRDERGDFVRIAEGTDATQEELAIHEVATSVYAFRREDLFRALPRVDRDNRQREYYLPDVLGDPPREGREGRGAAGRQRRRGRARTPAPSWPGPPTSCAAASTSATWTGA